MPIAVSEEHEALRLGALRWLTNHCPPEESRAAAESPTDELPPVWEKMAAQGWLGLHVPEADGGQGFGLSELAVVLEELGHALFPGPVLPTVLAAALLAQHGNAGQRARYLPGLVDGSAPAALALGAGTLHVADGPDGPTVSGTLRPVLGLGTASVLLAPFDDGGWGLLDPGQASYTALPALDATRRLGQADFARVPLPPEARLEGVEPEEVRHLALVLAAAEGTAGVSRKAFFNRWSTRDEFLPDALVYALVYDEVPSDAKDLAKQAPLAAHAPSLADSVIEIAEEVLDSLRRHPRSYLTLHIGPLLGQHPDLWEALLPSMRRGNEVWADGFASLIGELGVLLRPEWTPQRLALALQAALDGFLLRYRIQPADFAESSWEGAGIFADTVIALLIGIVDTKRTGESGRAALDALAAR